MISKGEEDPDGNQGDLMDSDEETDGQSTLKPQAADAFSICKPKNAKKGPFDFEQLKLTQELNNEHTGAIWVIKFRSALFNPLTTLIAKIKCMWPPICYSWAR